MVHYRLRNTVQGNLFKITQLFFVKIGANDLIQLSFLYLQN